VEICALFYYCCFRLYHNYPTSINAFLIVWLLSIQAHLNHALLTFDKLELKIAISLGYDQSSMERARPSIIEIYAQNIWVQHRFEKLLWKIYWKVHFNKNRSIFTIYQHITVQIEFLFDFIRLSEDHLSCLAMNDLNVFGLDFSSFSLR